MKNLLLLATVALTILRGAVSAQSPDPLVDTAFQLDYNPPGFGAGPVTVQPDGKIIISMAALRLVPDGNGGQVEAAVLETRRLNADGSLDTSFQPVPGSGPSLVLPGGDIVVAAGPLVHGDPGVMTRTDSAGTVIWSENLAPNDARALVRQPDGRLVVNSVHQLRRFMPDGTPDAGFQPDVSAPEQASAVEVRAVAALRSGKLLVSTDVPTVNSRLRRTFRLNADGSKDSTFTPLTQSYGSGACLAELPDGKLLAGGGDEATGGPGVVRLLPDGARDTAFTAPPLHPGTMVVQSDGRIIIGGYFLGQMAGEVRANPALLARLMPDGALDTSFGCPLCHRDNEDGQYVNWLAIGLDGISYATGAFIVPGTTLYGVVKLKTAPPAREVKFAVGLVDVQESAGKATIKVIRTGSTAAPASVLCFTDGLTAREWQDFVPAVQWLAFRSGESERTFTVRILPDSRTESPETLAVKLILPSAGTRLGTPRTATVRISD